MSKTRWLAIVSGINLAGPGAWAFLAPASFYRFATYPPYSKHFIHDIGAFLIGLGAVLVIAAFRRDGLFAAFAGNAVGAWLHTVSHLQDRALGGGSWRDPLLTALFAIVLTVGAVASRPAAHTEQS